MVKAYNEGKETHKDSSPHHLSFQNFTFLPLAIKKRKEKKKGIFTIKEVPLFDSFSYPNLVHISHFTKMSPIFFLPIFTIYNLFLDSFLFGCTLSTPLAKKGLVKQRQTFNTQNSPFFYLCK